MLGTSPAYGLKNLKGLVGFLLRSIKIASHCFSKQFLCGAVHTTNSHSRLRMHEVEALTPRPQKGAVLGDGAFKEVIKLK